MNFAYNQQKANHIIWVCMHLDAGNPSIPFSIRRLLFSTVPITTIAKRYSLSLPVTSASALHKIGNPEWEFEMF
jgi:hypothetical protein